MRFNAGLFVLIIGVFASLILLSPFIISGGSWMSLYGVFAIAAAVAIVMFVYLTASIAFIGRPEHVSDRNQRVAALAATGWSVVLPSAHFGGSSHV